MVLSDSKSTYVEWRFTRTTHRFVGYLDSRVCFRVKDLVVFRRQWNLSVCVLYAGLEHNQGCEDES